MHKIGGKLYRTDNEVTNSTRRKNEKNIFKEMLHNKIENKHQHECLLL